MNQISVIFPYKENGTWVFDDEKHGLVKEPFVSGMTEIFDKMTREIVDAEKGFKCLFSAQPFPGSNHVFDFVRQEFEGNWYRYEGAEGWLCPALFHYFQQAPEKIYVSALKL